ncbi:hypothetical protein VNI00_016536 [Paramarasmius palmivorus]|uniref:Uncharacterized protein n=1 Tax=Paramarasmius palmivorus TaxID=297713 RepID=A0AAW0BCM6_9AGAR
MASHPSPSSNHSGQLPVYSYGSMPISMQPPLMQLSHIPLALPPPPLRVLDMHIHRSVLSRAKFEFLSRFDTNEPDIDPSSNLAQFTEVPREVFDAHCIHQDIGKLIDELDLPQQRAAYILQIECVAISQYGIPFQVGIRTACRARAYLELVLPINQLKPDQLFSLRMMTTSHVLSDIPVDYVAAHYDHGAVFGIKYPKTPWGDWTPEDENADGEKGD